VESFEATKVRFPHLKEFFPFLEALNKESARGRALISAGFLEEQLKRILLAFMLEGAKADELIEGANAPLGTFSARTTACHVLGLITDNERDDLNLIRRIRNDFAHQVHTSFQTESIVSRCDQLKFKAKNYKKVDGTPVDVEADGQFTTAAVGLILTLTNRAHYVAQQRRTSQTWPD